MTTAHLTEGVMPTKREGEKLSDFIGRFVSNKREERKFPNKAQRLAVGYSEAREQAKKERHHVKG